MRGLVIFLLILVIIASFSFVVASINNENLDNSKKSEFSTFTSAVCENYEDIINCKDEVFVNCNGNVSKAKYVAECNGIKVDIKKASGFAVFGKEWKDPRD